MIRVCGILGLQASLMVRYACRLKSAAKLPEVLLRALGILAVAVLTGQVVYAQEGFEPHQEKGAKKERERIVDMSVLFKYEADEDGYLAKALFGLFKLEKDGPSHSRLAVRPFLYRERDDERKVYDTTFFYGLGGWRRERETLYSWAFPLYYLKHSSEETTFLAPFVYANTGKDSSTWLFYPFFGYSESPWREKYYFAFPFFSYTHYQSGRDVVDAPFPLARYSSGPRGDWLHIFPFVWYDAHPNGNGTVILFPVFWATSHADRRFSLLFPFYWDYASDDSSFFMLLPFYAQSREGKFTSSTVIFPFYWNFSSPDSSLFLVVPLYGYYKAQDINRIMLGFPLFSYTERRLPERRELGFCDSQIDLLWPIFAFRNAPNLLRFRLLPLCYGADYNLTETGTRGNSTSDYFHIVPMLWSGRQKTEEFSSQYLYIVPLLWWGTEKADKRESRYLCVLPFFWSYDSPEKKLFHLWPYGQLKFKERKESQYFLAYPLLHIRTYEPQGLFEVNIPAGLALFKYEIVNATVDTLEGKLTGKQTEIRLFPIFSLLTRPGKFQFVSLPVTYKEQIDVRRQKYHSVNLLLWSFFGEWSKEESYWRLFYGISHYKRSPEGKEFYILDMEPLFDWQLFSYVDRKEDGEVELSPLFKYRSRKDDYEFNTIFGLFGWGRKKGENYLKLFWFLKPKL